MRHLPFSQTRSPKSSRYSECDMATRPFSYCCQVWFIQRFFYSFIIYSISHEKENCKCFRKTSLEKRPTRIEKFRCSLSAWVQSQRPAVFLFRHAETTIDTAVGAVIGVLVGATSFVANVFAKPQATRKQSKF